ncbi:MAG: hypothetical protein AAGC73_09010 [Verrucomicrobiota bacterium]
MCARIFLGLLLLPLILLAETPTKLRVSSKYLDAVQARIDDKYAVVVKKDGSKLMVPISSLREDDLTWLKHVSRKQTVARGTSTVQIVDAEKLKTEKQPKETILVSETKNGVETVLLCPPNVFRDQIGGTCMLYARVHWLDIAGYYTRQPDIYKIINDTPTHTPWESQRYVDGLTKVVTSHKPRPRIFKAPSSGNNFQWAREQLRNGRPILAAFPREIWQALPSEFIAERIWSGGSIGHQIVVNGFTYNSAKGTGTFHIVNSWSELQQFDLKLRDARGGNIVFEMSMVPYGQVAKKAKKRGKEKAATQQVVRSIRLLKTVGDSKLYEVTTDTGVRRVLAPDQKSARRMIEEDG